MYDELVKRLRLCAQFRCRKCEYESVVGCRAKLNAEAADAIEKLSKRVPPAPHGRLIDAGKIYDAVEQRYRMSSGIEHRCERDLLDLICAAPAIIPAEEGE